MSTRILLLIYCRTKQTAHLIYLLQFQCHADAITEIRDYVFCRTARCVEIIFTKNGWPTCTHHAWSLFLHIILTSLPWRSSTNTNGPFLRPSVDVRCLDCELCNDKQWPGRVGGSAPNLATSLPWADWRWDVYGCHLSVAGACTGATSRVVLLALAGFSCSATRPTAKMFT